MLFDLKSKSKSFIEKNHHNRTNSFMFHLHNSFFFNEKIYVVRQCDRHVCVTVFIVNSASGCYFRNFNLKYYWYRFNIKKKKCFFFAHRSLYLLPIYVKNLVYRCRLQCWDFAVNVYVLWVTLKLRRRNTLFQRITWKQLVCCWIKIINKWNETYRIVLVHTLATHAVSVFIAYIEKLLKSADEHCSLNERYDGYKQWLHQ